MKLKEGLLQIEESPRNNIKGGETVKEEEKSKTNSRRGEGL